MSRSNIVHASLGFFEETVTESNVYLERGFTSLHESIAGKPIIFSVQKVYWLKLILINSKNEYF